jgi:site-specific DNA recombinase
MKLTRIGIYARVSSEGQAKDGTIDSQITTLREYAAKKGETIDNDLIFSDNGVSGGILERPGLDKLRDMAFSGQISKVYVLCPDRLARKGAHQMLLVEEFKKLGVEFGFYNREISDSPEDQLLLQVQGVIAEYEKEKILERSRRGKLHAAKRGQVSVFGRGAYGYIYHKANNHEGAKLTINAQEAAVVREIFDLYCYKKYTIRAICAHLREKGYLTRFEHSMWRTSAVAFILNNPAYMGKAAFRRTMRFGIANKNKISIEKKAGKSRQISGIRARPKSEWIEIPVPSIIDVKTFEIAQERRKENARFSRRNSKSEFLLTGIARCALCNYAVYGATTSYVSKTGKQSRYYHCSGVYPNKFSSTKKCHGKYVRTEVLENLVWSAVKELLLDPGSIAIEYEKRISNLANDGAKQLKIEKLREQRSLETEKSRIVDLYQCGLIEKDDLTVRLNGIKNRFVTLNQELQYLEQQEHEKDRFLTVVNNISDFMQKLNMNLDTCSFEDRRNLVRLTVKEVFVNSKEKTIQIRHIVPTSKQFAVLRSTRDHTEICEREFIVLRHLRPPWLTN